MPPRSPNIPHAIERTALQALIKEQPLPAWRLHPAGKKTVAGMLSKGWTRAVMDARKGNLYLLTQEGEAAFKARIVEPGSVRDR